MAYSKTYISESELSKLIGASNITSLKKELGVYAKYEGPVVRIVEFDRQLQIREDDASVERLLVELLSGMCQSEEPFSSRIADGKTIEEAFLSFSKENLTRPFTSNPTLNDAIYVFSELKNRQHIRTLLNTALQLPEFSELASSRAVKGFNSLLSDIEEGNDLKTNLDHHGLYLKEGYTWVAEVIYSYRGDSNLEEVRYLDGIVKYTKPTSTKNSVYVEECSNGELIGRNVVLENEVSDEHLLFNKDVYLTEARSRNIPIKLCENTTITPISSGSVHPTREPYLNMIEQLFRLFKIRSKNYRSTSLSEAIERLNLNDEHDGHKVIKIHPLNGRTLNKYLGKKEAETELLPQGQAPYLKAISSLSHAITGTVKTVKTEVYRYQDKLANEIATLSCNSDASPPIAKEDILLFLNQSLQ